MLKQRFDTLEEYIIAYELLEDSYQKLVEVLKEIEENSNESNRMWRKRI